MLGSNNIRKELIEDAIAPVDNALKMGEGSIKVFTDDIIKKISRETKRSENVVRQRIIENPNFELYDETIYNDYLDIIKKKADFEVIEKLLKTLNSEDIYSFLKSQNLKFETLDNSVINKESQTTKKVKIIIQTNNNIFININSIFFFFGGEILFCVRFDFKIIIKLIICKVIEINKKIYPILFIKIVYLTALFIAS